MTRRRTITTSLATGKKSRGDEVKLLCSRKKLIPKGSLHSAVPPSWMSHPSIDKEQKTNTHCMFPASKKYLDVGLSHEFWNILARDGPEKKPTALKSHGGYFLKGVSVCQNNLTQHNLEKLKYLSMIQTRAYLDGPDTELELPYLHSALY